MPSPKRRIIKIRTNRRIAEMAEYRSTALPSNLLLFEPMLLSKKIIGFSVISSRSSSLEVVVGNGGSFSAAAVDKVVGEVLRVDSEGVSGGSVVLSTSLEEVIGSSVVYGGGCVVGAFVSTNTSHPTATFSVPLAHLIECLSDCSSGAHGRKLAST